VNEADCSYLAAAVDRIQKLLAARGAVPLCPQGLSPELQAFAESFDRLLEAMDALRSFVIALGNGNLNHEAPPKIYLLSSLKQLQANLRHLTWQTHEIAAGNLDQEVDFLGEFSVAFNQMIQGLREKRLAEEKIRHLSLHDALTGLYNRTFFNEEMERLHASQHLYPIGFVIADLDDLKPTNDNHGHQVGDLLIQRVSRLLEHSVRAEDVVARIGGDEFAIILYGTDQATANIVTARIRDALSSYNRRNQNIPIHLSLGIGIASQPASLQDAFRQADQAMYENKITRKGRMVR
jgi:diguanylate cyclase (GGDEF)-like protein